jgi:hypothetical protein
VRKLFASVVALFSIKGAVAGQELPSTTKQISYRGGLVVFSLPSSWTEEYESDGGGVFYAPGEDTGTLRLNVITAKAPTPILSSASRGVLQKIGHPDAESLLTGSSFSKRVSRGDEQGRPITTYSWYVANVVEPDRVRIATFSYSILSSQEQSARVTADLSFLERSIRNIRFNSTLGN